MKFLYGNIFGRIILKIIMVLHLDRFAVKFLWSRMSKRFADWYVKKNHIICTGNYSTFREMFTRTRKNVYIDTEANHIISPCDGLLSYYTIDKNSCFSIKNSEYRLKDFVQDDNIASKYRNGLCLIFRLCPSDYHHYCYIDNGYQGKYHYISGVLHSVQPIACENYPVYVLNKRCWSVLESENFGAVLQCEIGALLVGDIINEQENKFVKKGEEKGYFELAGSTVVMLFEPNRARIRDSIKDKLTENDEVRVIQGEWIGSAQ